MKESTSFPWKQLVNTFLSTECVPDHVWDTLEMKYINIANLSVPRVTPEKCLWLTSEI